MYRIGIDLGGTNIAAGIVSEEGKILLQGSTPTLATRTFEEVIADIVESLRNDWANPSSISTQGLEVRKKVEEARKQIAEYINAEPEEIIFTASGSEANNLAINGFLKANKGYYSIITTEIEHPSVYNTCLNSGAYMSCVPVHPSGRIYPDLLQDMLNTDHLHLVSIMMVNNEIGTVQDIKWLAEITHRFNGVFHTDATQSFGKIPIDVKDLDVDLMSVGLHKCGLPRGVSFLYKKKGIALSPIIHGGHQESNLRAGTENTAYIIAAGKHIERLKGKGYLTHEMISYLFNKIYDGVIEIIPEFYINGSINPGKISPTILSLTFPGISAEALITLLDMRDVQVSAGSACSSGQKKPSRVLTAIGLSDEDAASTIRIGIGTDTTKEECDEFVKALVECLMSLKMMDGE